MNEARLGATVGNAGARLYVRLGDAGVPPREIAEPPIRIDEGVERIDDLVPMKPDGAYLYDLVVLLGEAGGLQIDGDPVIVERRGRVCHAHATGDPERIFCRSPRPSCGARPVWPPRPSLVFDGGDVARVLVEHHGLEDAAHYLAAARLRETVDEVDLANYGDGASSCLTVRRSSLLSSSDAS